MELAGPKPPAANHCGELHASVFAYARRLRHDFRKIRVDEVVFPAAARGRLAGRLADPLHAVPSYLRDLHARIARKAPYAAAYDAKAIDASVLVCPVEKYLHPETYAEEPPVARSRDDGLHKPHGLEVFHRLACGADAGEDDRVGRLDCRGIARRNGLGSEGGECVPHARQIACTVIYDSYHRKPSTVSRYYIKSAVIVLDDFSCFTKR